MTYWIDLFTGTTWEEFKAYGASLSGFRAKMKNAASRLKPGDVMLCYMAGVMSWVGALEVIGPSSKTDKVWGDEDFPVRVDVKPLVLLTAETGVPMAELAGKVDFYSTPSDKGKYRGFVRSSPAPFKVPADAELILNLMHAASKHPIVHPVDPKKFAYRPVSRFKVERKVGKQLLAVEVSVPEPEESRAALAAETNKQSSESSDHTRMQFFLLRLGASLGFDVWVARNDKSRTYKDQALGAMYRIVDHLPTQFNEATTRTIELIDVLWLKGNSIIAAFEIECTTSVSSGLLRMSDLLALQPNLDIRLYLVAPDARKTKVEQEILRPTFTLREKPLHSMCGFIPESVLLQKVKAAEQHGLLVSLKPEFLESIAQYFNR